MNYTRFLTLGSKSNTLIHLSGYTLAALLLISAAGCGALALPGAPSADPAAPQDQEAFHVPQVRVTTTLNVRNGPSPDCLVIGSYVPDNEVEVLAASPDNGWWLVPYMDRHGWMYGGDGYTTPIDDLSGVQALEAWPGCGDNATDPAALGIVVTGGGSGSGGGAALQSNCGDGFCDQSAGEDAARCAADCAALSQSAAQAASCGNGTCEPGLNENTATCAQDCGAGNLAFQPQALPQAPANCGNGACNLPDENYGNCAADCTDYCGDAVCDPTETSNTCGDCACGDGYCDAAEVAAGTCSADCTGMGALAGGQGGIDSLPDGASGGSGGGMGSIIDDGSGSMGSIVDDGTTAVKPNCGNGRQDSGETCDPPYDTCSADEGLRCQVESCLCEFFAACGNGRCDVIAGENYSSCYQDCMGYCGDGVCDAQEEVIRDSCEISSYCPQDCGSRQCQPSSCNNDGFCDSSAESCLTCPGDCGECSECDEEGCTLPGDWEPSGSGF